MMINHTIQQNVIRSYFLALVLQQNSSISFPFRSWLILSLVQGHSRGIRDLLYSWITHILFTHYQTILLQQLGTNTETHSLTMCKEILDYSVLNLISPQISLLGAQAALWKRRQKDCKSRGEMETTKEIRSSKHSMIKAHVTQRNYSSLHRACEVLALRVEAEETLHS